MARIRTNTRTHTKEKTVYLINSYFFKIGKANKTKKKSIGWVKYVYVCEWDMCWRNFCNFPWWLKNVKSRSKIGLFFKRAPFWNLISKHEKQLRFSEVNYGKFCMWQLHFPKTRGNKNKPWTHSTPIKFTFIYIYSFLSCVQYSIYHGTPSNNGWPMFMVVGDQLDCLFPVKLKR